MASGAQTSLLTGAIMGVTVQQQTAQCLANIQAILEEAGSFGMNEEYVKCFASTLRRDWEKILSVTVVLADEEDFAGSFAPWSCSRLKLTVILVPS